MAFLKYVPKKGLKMLLMVKYDDYRPLLTDRQMDPLAGISSSCCQKVINKPRLEKNTFLECFSHNFITKKSKDAKKRALLAGFGYRKEIPALRAGHWGKKYH